MKNTNKAQTMLIVAMVIWGTVGLFVRNITLPSTEIAFYRAVLAVLFLMVYMMVKKQNVSFHKIKKQIPVLLVSGVVLAWNWIFLFQAYKHTTVSMATICYYFAPVLVIILCPVLFREKLTKMQVVCFIMSTLGLLLITGIGNLSGSSNHLMGIMYGLLAASFYALVIILNKHMKDIDAMDRTFLQLLSAAIVMFPYVALTGGFYIGQLDAKGIISLLIMGFIHTGIAYMLYFPAIKELAGQKTAILSYIDPLVAVLVSVCILGEAMTGVQLVGGLLILGFTCLNEIKGLKE